MLADLVHEALEARQAIGEARVQMLAQTDFVGGGVHRDFAFGGVVAQLFQGGRTDLPAWDVDHPQESVVVVRVHDQAEVGHQVFHFLTSEKAVAAGQAIRNLVVLQLQLDQLGLVITAVQDREITVRPVRAQVQGQQFHGHTLGFGVFVAATDYANLVAVAHLAPQLLFEFVRVVRDQHVGTAQNAAGGAVVLLQHHHFQGRIIVLEQHQVFRSGAAPGVDRLVIVADHCELVAYADQ